MKRIQKLLVAFLFLPFLAACSAGEVGSDNGKLNVVVTNSILADMTKNIAGDQINLHSIVPIGQDPHEYEPLPEDVAKASEADLIFYNGINLENGEDGWFSKMVKNAQKVENQNYFAASDGVEVIYLEGQSAKGKEDPHAWLSLENGIIYAQNIAKQLMAKNPKNKDVYQQNLVAYTQELAALDATAKSRFAAIPADKKLIVTSEGCFKYFSKAYDIPSAYIWEINTEEEGTSQQTRDLVQKLKSGPTPAALFVESSVDDRPMKTISRETGIPIYAKIFTDSVANEGEDGDSYLAMMKWNLEKIAEGLQSY